MKIKRLSLIKKLVSEQKIETQEDLRTLLKEHGLDVTQATISRDIRNLMLIKVADSNGKYYYTSPVSDSLPQKPNQNTNILVDGIITVDHAENITVIHCHSGMAGAVCTFVDSFNFTGIVGTVAGDDTIFVCMRSQKHAQSFMNYLKELKEG